MRNRFLNSVLLLSACMLTSVVAQETTQPYIRFHTAPIFLSGDMPDDGHEEPDDGSNGPETEIPTFANQPADIDVFAGQSQRTSFGVSNPDNVALTYDIVAAGSGVTVPTWLVRSGFDVIAAPEPSVGAASYGPFAVIMNAPGMDSILSSSFTVDVSAQAMAFTSQPGSVTSEAGRTEIAAFTVDTHGASGLQYRVVSASGTTTPPAWIGAINDRVTFAIPSGTPAGTIGPFQVEVTAAGRDAIRSGEFSVNVIGKMAFTQNPQNISLSLAQTKSTPFAVNFNTPTPSTATMRVRTAGTPVVEAPSWIKVVNGTVQAITTATLAPGTYGPYVVEVSAAGRATQISGQFSVTVAIGSAASIRPDRGEIQNYSIAAGNGGNVYGTVQWQNLIGAMYDRLDNPIVTYNYNRDLAGLALEFDTAPVTGNTCVVRVGGTLPATFNLMILVYDANNQSYLKTIPMTRSAGINQYSGNCLPTGATSIRRIIASLDVVNMPYTFYEFRVGSGGVYPQ